MIPLTVNKPAPLTSLVNVALTGTTTGAVGVEITGGVRAVATATQDCTFSADLELHPNAVNHLFVTAIYGDGTPSPPMPVTITHDQQPPTLFIGFPEDGVEIATEPIDVAGRVGDLLSGFMDLTVTVNGLDAVVDVGGRGLRRRDHHHTIRQSQTH